VSGQNQDTRYWCPHCPMFRAILNPGNIAIWMHYPGCPASSENAPSTATDTEIAVRRQRYREYACLAYELCHTGEETP